MNYFKYSIWCKDNYERVINGNINNNKIVIIGLSWCPWTERAKKLIKKEYNVDPVMLLPDLVDNEYKLNLLYCLNKKVNTVYTPQIWIDQKHIGDFEHLYKLTQLENKKNIEKD